MFALFFFLCLFSPISFWFNQERMSSLGSVRSYEMFNRFKVSVSFIQLLILFRGFVNKKVLHDEEDSLTEDQI